MPFVLMNSYATNDDSLAMLDKFPDLRSGVPFSFMQHKFAKILHPEKL